MPKFIKLTQKDMDPVHFNIDHISTIIDNDCGACVTTIGCDETYYIVKETSEQILELIRAALFSGFFIGEMKMRKIIQICSESESAYTVSHLTALCDDGTIWELARDGEWERLPDITQDEEIKSDTPSQTVDDSFFTPNWDAIIRDRTLLRTRDGLKALVLSKDNSREFPLSGLVISDTGWLVPNFYAITGKVDYTPSQDDIVGYWGETNNE